MTDFGFSALPTGRVIAFPLLLVLVSVLLFSTATLAFYLKQRISLTRLGGAFARVPGLRGNATGALLGAATPFCTCTAIPLFVGLLEVDAPLGPAVSFLLASPTINLGAIVVLLVVFGWRIALFYGVACLAAAIVVGWGLGRVPRRQALADYFWIQESEPEPSSSQSALAQAARLGGLLTRRLLPWLALATAAGIVVDLLISTSTLAHLGTLGPIGIPLAALLGAVIYADILLLIPVGYALVQHGASLPIVLTFMLAASGISLAEVLVLGRVLKTPLAVAFAVSTVVVYTLLGYGFVVVCGAAT